MTSGGLKDSSFRPPLVTSHPGLPLILFVVVGVSVIVVVGVIFGDVEFDGVESDYLKPGCALVAGDLVTLVGVEVNMDFGFAVRTGSYRHVPFLQVA